MAPSNADSIARETVAGHSVLDNIKIPKPGNSYYLLRLVLLGVEGLGMILFGISISKQRDEIGSPFFSTMALITLAFGFLVSLCFTLSMFAYRKAPEGRTHPGCLVGWDLVAWGFIFPIAIIVSVVVAYDSDFDACSNNNIDDCPDMGLVKRIEAVGNVMMYIATGLHFWFFVKACIAVDRLRIGKMAAAMLKEEGRQSAFELASRTPGGEIERV